jgi:hypothetical protein
MMFRKKEDVTASFSSGSLSLSFEETTRKETT